MASDNKIINGKVQMNERERLIQTELRARAGELGSKLKTLFGLQIAILGFAAIAFIVALCASGDTAEDAFWIILFSAIASLVCSVIYCVTLMSMGKYDDEFSGAGALFIAAAICSCIKSIFGTGNGIGSLFSLISSALSIGYMLKFSTGMINSFQAICNGMADDWESYKKAYLVATIGSIASVVVVFMPGLYGLGMLGSLCFAIMGIVVGIWMIILLYKSSVEMKAFSTSPIDTTKRTPGAGGFHNISVGSSRPSSARITSTKTGMSRAEAIKKAEEMRQRREAKASGSEISAEDSTAKPDLDKEQETIDMLKKYKELLDSGAITEEEFDAKKKELLG